LPTLIQVSGQSLLNPVWQTLAAMYILATASNQMKPGRSRTRNSASADGDQPAQLIRIDVFAIKTQSIPNRSMVRCVKPKSVPPRLPDFVEPVKANLVASMQSSDPKEVPASSE
jgi:hypothetical protein